MMSGYLLVEAQSSRNFLMGIPIVRGSVMMALQAKEVLWMWVVLSRVRGDFPVSLIWQEILQK
jgi:hypothetical protein